MFDACQFIKTTSGASIDAGALLVCLDLTPGTNTLTMPAVQSPGQLKVIYASAGTYSTTLTQGTNITGGSASTTITWSAANQGVLLISGPTKWVVVKDFGGILLS